MGGGGGGDTRSWEERNLDNYNRQQQAQLMQMQVEDQMREREEAARLASPEYQAQEQARLAAEADARARGEFTTGRTQALNTQLQAARAALADAGLSDRAPEIEQRINADYAGLQYAPGVTADSLLGRDYVGDIIRGTRAQRRDQAFNTAKDTGLNRLDALGASDLRQRFADTLYDKYNAVGLNANTYSDIFNPDTIVDSVLGTERTNRRQQYGVQANQAFAPYDPNKAFGDTADDSYINDILGREFSSGEQALQRARARGGLNETGFNAAFGALGDARKSALATANTLGGAVLTRNRGELEGIRSKAATEAGAWDFGKQFNVNDFLNQYTGKQQSLTEGLGGEIAGALSGQKWFDIGDVLTKGGYAQGAQNGPGNLSGYSTPAALAAQEERNKLRVGSRGLGGSGTF